MIAEKLRKAILLDAIKGKLTNQCQGDETASDLLGLIDADRMRQIQEKRVSIVPAHTVISDEEIPFEIPENWIWVRFEDVTSYGRTNKVTLQVDKDTWLLELDQIEKSTSRLITRRNLGETFSLNSKSTFKKGMILYSKLRPYLDKVLLADDDGVCTSEIVPFLTYMGVSSEYVVYFMKSPYFIDYVVSRSYGVKMPRVGTDEVQKCLIPLPPYSEQIRIVNELRRALETIELLESDELSIKRLQQQFPDKMKYSILQYAFQGKLTHQQSEEGDAMGFLQDVEISRRRIFRDGVLKKEIDCSAITADDLPFEIPVTWKWARLSQLLALGDGIFSQEPNLPLIDAAFLRGRGEKRVASNGRFVEINSVIILVDGENSGEIFIAPCDGYLGSTFRKLVVFDKRAWPYIRYFLKMQQDFLHNNKTGSAIPHLNKKLFKEMLIPVPPIEEQKRIVLKLDSVFAVIESLVM